MAFKCFIFIFAFSLLLQTIDAKPPVSATAKWILACRNPDGGFGLYPGDGSNLPATCFAVQSLRMLDIHLTKPELTSSWVLTCQKKENGGFKSRWGNRADTAKISQTYYAVKTLELTGFLKTDKTRIINFIYSKQQADGAFEKDFWWYPDKKDRSFMAETYQAVSALIALGEKPRESVKILEWLKDRQLTQFGNGSFGFRKVEFDLATPEGNGYTYSTGMGLYLLSVLGGKAADTAKSAKYLMELQQKDGGFTMGLGRYREYNDRNQGRISDAYWALQGLSLLRVAIPDTAALVEWVTACQRNDGGFGRRPSFSPSEMEATFDAVAIFKQIGKPLPTPRNPENPVRDTIIIKPQFVTDQMNPENPDEMRYLYRIAMPIYKKFIVNGEKEVALKLSEWVNDNVVFGDQYSKSSADALLQGYGACGSQARCYVGLANIVGIQSRMLHVEGHSAAESKINGRWAVIDPMFNDYAHDPRGIFSLNPQENMYSAIRVHDNYLMNGDKKLTIFGDWRYSTFSLEKPDGNVWTIDVMGKAQDAVRMGAYTNNDY